MRTARAAWQNLQFFRFSSFGVRLSVAWPAKFAWKNEKNMTDAKLTSYFAAYSAVNNDDNKYTEGKRCIFLECPSFLVQCKVTSIGSSENERFPRVSTASGSATCRSATDLPPLLAGSFHAPRDPNWTFSSHHEGPEKKNRFNIPTGSNTNAHISVMCCVYSRGLIFFLSGRTYISVVLVLILKIWSHRWTSRS